MCLIMMSGHVLNIGVSEQTAFGLETLTEEAEEKGKKKQPRASKQAEHVERCQQRSHSFHFAHSIWLINGIYHCVSFSKCK
jgi:hypothetical protein